MLGKEKESYRIVFNETIVKMLNRLKYSFCLLKLKSFNFLFL